MFIDSVSTGFTRTIDKDDERSYHHFEKDIEVSYFDAGHMM